MSCGPQVPGLVLRVLHTLSHLIPPEVKELPQVISLSKLKNYCFKVTSWEFPDSPVVRTRRFHRWGLGWIPGWGTKILQASWHGQKKKREK